MTPALGLFIRPCWYVDQKIKVKLYMCTNATFVSNSASVKGRTLYAPRMRLTPGYSSRPMPTNATPWKGISGFSSASYMNTRTHMRFHWTQRLTHQTCTGWKHPPFLFRLGFSFWTYSLITKSSHRLGICCFCQWCPRLHNLHRPEPVFCDPLPQPEITVNTDTHGLICFSISVSLWSGLAFLQWLIFPKVLHVVVSSFPSGISASF